MPGFLNDGFLGGKGKGGGARGEPGKTPTIGPNGNWFIGGVDSGQSAKAKLDLSKFKQNELATVDANTGELVPSGVFAHDGEVETEPDSVIIGAHEWSSSAENMTVTNLATGKVYAPLWQEVAPDAKEAYIRAHGDLQQVQRFNDKSTRITNPSFSVPVTHDETAFSVGVVLAEPATSIVMEVFLAGKKLYRSRWGAKPAGEVTLELNTPSDFKANAAYQVKFTSEEGDVVMLGDSKGNPIYKVNFVTWADEKIATEAFVLDNAGGSGSGTQPIPLTAEDVSKAIDHGAYLGGGSVKSLDYGWWVIKADNTAVTGRPSEARGDLIVFKNSVKGASASSGFSVMLAFGKDAEGKSAIWAEYRDGTAWTPWFRVNDDVDLTTLTTAVAQLERRSTVVARDMLSLKTQIGNIYAPNKVAFDNEVNALIDAKIKETKPSGGGVRPTVVPRIYALFSNSIPTSLSTQGTVTSTNGEATLARTGTTISRVCVLVENDNDEAERVTGISVNDGIAASWTPRDTVIDGKKYRALFSAGAYTETSLRIKVNFR